MTAAVSVRRFEGTLVLTAAALGTVTVVLPAAPADAAGTTVGQRAVNEASRHDATG
jgi:hypothetical protein